VNKQQEFKDTEIGRIPKDWKGVVLKEICEMERGFSYRSDQLTDEETETEFITINNIEKEGGLKKTIGLYLRDIVEVDEKFYVDNDDLLIANTDMAKGYIIGAPLLIKDIEKRCVFSMDLTRLLPRSNNLLTSFFFYLLSHSKIRNFMKRNAQGTNVLHLNHQLVSSLKLPLPPLPEQQKIAEILSTVDQAIEKVDEAITRTERLKRGLMQELLTKGIGHKEFKDTEIGKIPKEWKVVRIGDESVADLIMGQSPPSSTYNNTGIGLPFLQGNAEFGEMYPTPVLSCSHPIKIAEENDILLSVRAPVGDVNIAPFKSCIGRGLTAIRPKSNKLEYLFLFYCLKFRSRLFKSISMGSTFKAIRKEEIKNLKLPLPPLSEQKKIAEILSTVDKRLELLREKKERLRRIKKGLMNDLLTGRRRVKI